MRKVTVIAEIGINHGGDMPTALKMIDYARQCGADIAKFQWYRPEQVLGADSPYFAEAKKAELSREQVCDLKTYCDERGIEFGLSIFHPDQVDFTEQIGLKRYKIASRSAKDNALLREIDRTGKPVILSTGMCDFGDVDKAMNWINNCDVTLLYCVCKYPAPLQDIDLSVMLGLKKLAEKVGFSSHCPSIYPTLAAVAEGAVVTENHVACSRSDEGCDISASLDFNQFDSMIRGVRELEVML